MFYMLTSRNLPKHQSTHTKHSTSKCLLVVLVLPDKNAWLASLPYWLDRPAAARQTRLLLSSSINYSLSVQNIGGQRVGDDKGGNSGTKNQFFLPPDSNDMTRKACKSFLLSRGMANLCSATIHYFTAIYPSSSLLHTCVSSVVEF